MRFTRRHFFLGSLALPAAAQRKAAPQRPNIVLVLADDLAAWMLGCYGNKEIRTPHIDLLARTGTRLNNAFAISPVSSASRATLFTGRTPAQHGILDFLTPNPSPLGQAAPPASFRDEVMLSDLLAKAGYECGYSGKWHMGGDEQPQHGFRFWYTLSGAAAPYRDPAMNFNGKPVQEKGYLGDLITQRAGEFLGQQSASRPFFLTVSYLNPGGAYEGHPQRYYDMYAQTTFETTGWLPAAPNASQGKEMLRNTVAGTRLAAAAVTALDDQVAALVKLLQARGVYENTLIIFTSPNGFLLGRHGLWGNGHGSEPPNMFEEVVNVPMVWAWLGRIPADNTRPELVDACDFLPAVCEAAGADAPTDRNLPGRSYFPIITGRPLPKKDPWRNMVHGHLRNTWMTRDLRYKIVIREPEGPHELYDLRTDPGERTNQYANPQFVTVRDRLHAELAGWRKKYGG